MKDRNPTLYLAPLLITAGSLLTGLKPHILTDAWKLQSVPLHSAVEAVPAMAAILMALLLFQRTGKSAGKLSAPAIGFIAMGILDSLHAVASPGQGFVLLRAVSSLAGGFWFALVWLPDGAFAASGAWRKWLPIGTAAASFFLGIWVLTGGTLPEMVRGGEFTPAATAINFAAGALFLAGAAYFFLDFRASGKADSYLYACMALLFGLAGLMFRYSKLWDDAWWFWHFYRLAAFLLVLWFINKEHAVALSDLRVSLARRTLAEEELRKAHRRISVLYSIERAASRSLDLDEVLGNALDAAIGALDTDAGGIVLLEPDDRTLTLRIHRGLSEEFARNLRCFAIGEGVSGRAVAERKPIILAVPEYPTARLAPFMAREGLETIASAPLLSGGRAIGALTLGTKRARAFPPEETDLLASIGLQLGLVIRNARLYEEARRELNERRRAEKEIQRLNAELEHRVVERTAQLEAANRELETFSYSVSHDLRAPLRSVDGFSQALLEDYADRLDARGADYLRRVRAASQRMAQLIDDLLNLSRLARSGMKRERVALSALAEAIADELRAAQPGRRVEFVTAMGAAAEGDARMLRVALENLLGNAWKFTGRHPRARIEFGAEEAGGKKVFFVKDDGAGFDMRYSDKLFGAFQRLHGTSEFPGTGIGLATVRRIIHRHGGKIWAEGEVEKGATFYFTLG